MRYEAAQPIYLWNLAPANLNRNRGKYKYQYGPAGARSRTLNPKRSARGRFPQRVQWLGRAHILQLPNKQGIVSQGPDLEQIQYGRIDHGQTGATFVHDCGAKLCEGAQLPMRLTKRWPLTHIESSSQENAFMFSATACTAWQLHNCRSKRHHKENNFSELLVLLRARWLMVCGKPKHLNTKNIHPMNLQSKFHGLTVGSSPAIMGACVASLTEGS